MIIYDIRCENGHKFEGWFHDRQAWIDQNERRLIGCPVCGSSSVEIVPSSVAIRGKDSQKRSPQHEKDISPARALQLLHQFIDSHFENVGDKFAEVALKMHCGDEEKRNIQGTTTKQEEADLKEEGVMFVKIPLPKLDS